MEQLTKWYFTNKRVIIQCLLLAATVVAIVNKSDFVRSFSLGFAAGLLLVSLGSEVAASKRARNTKHPLKG